MNFYITSPASVMEARRRMMRRLFDETEETETVYSVPMNLTSNADEYVVSAYVPGLAVETVNIQFNGGLLTVDGEFPEIANEGQDVHFMELPVGKFSRTIEFKDAIAADKIEAKLKDGLLTLHIPRAEEAKPRTIKINAK